MNISKIVLILLVLNVSCLASNGEEAIQQPAQAQPSFWSNLKYLNPLYYWREYTQGHPKSEKPEEAEKAEQAKIAAIQQKMLNELDNDIARYQSDIDRLNRITTLDELQKQKGNLKTSFALYLFRDPMLHTDKERLGNIPEVIDELQTAIQALEARKKEIEASPKRAVELQKETEQKEEELRKIEKFVQIAQPLAQIEEEIRQLDAQIEFSACRHDLSLVVRINTIEQLKAESKNFKTELPDTIFLEGGLPSTEKSFLEKKNTVIHQLKRKMKMLHEFGPFDEKLQGLQEKKKDLQQKLEKKREEILQQLQNQELL